MTGGQAIVALPSAGTESNMWLNGSMPAKAERDAERDIVLGVLIA